jgi:hypothetical protein
MSFYCDVGRLNHQARVPTALPYPAGTTNNTVPLFLAAYPWAEDAEFVTHTWNPFALVTTFQWLTAGFALRTVASPAWNGVVSTVWCVWLALGYGLYMVWSLTSFGGPFCVAMFATITASYVAAAVLCLMFVGSPSLSVLYHRGVVYAKVPPDEQPKSASAGTTSWMGEDGRTWSVLVFLSERGARTRGDRSGWVAGSSRSPSRPSRRPEARKPGRSLGRPRPC